MEAIVVARRHGHLETRVGTKVSDGPECLRLLLTRPYHEAGHIIEIPRRDIESVSPIEPCALGDDPKTT